MDVEVTHKRSSHLSCCVPCCTNTAQNSTREVTFHCFPKNEVLRKVWIAKIKRDVEKKFKITNHTKVCSDHFNKSDFRPLLHSTKRYLKSDAFPSCFQWISAQEMLPVEESQTNSGNQPSIQRFSRNHKITPHRTPIPKPPSILSSFQSQHYPSAGINYNSSSADPFSKHGESLPHNRFNNSNNLNWQNNYPTRNLFTNLTAFNQHYGNSGEDLNRRPQMSDKWNNYNRTAPQPNFIQHEEKTIKIIGDDDPIKKNYVMQTSTLRTYFSTPRGENSSSRMPLPQLESIDRVVGVDLKRIAEMSRRIRQNNSSNETAIKPQTEVTNNNQSELEKHLMSPTAAAINNSPDTDNNDLEIISPVEHARMNCPSPITISDDSEEEKIESYKSPTPTPTPTDVIMNEDVSMCKVESMITEETINKDITDSFPNDSFESLPEFVPLHTELLPSNEIRNVNTEFAPSNDTIEAQSESQLLNDINETNEKIEEQDLNPNSVIKLRFCTMKRNEDNSRELISTGSIGSGFSVYRLKKVLASEKLPDLPFKKKPRLSEDECVTGKIVVNGEKIVEKPTKKNSFRAIKVGKRSMSTNSANTYVRKLIDVTICWKCKRRIINEEEHGTFCESTDTYPCLDPKCEKAFLLFAKYEAHVKAHGYRVSEPKAQNTDSDESSASQPSQLSDPIRDEIKCLFCDDTFPQCESLKLHLKQLHQMKNECEFFNNDSIQCLFFSIEDWLRGLGDNENERCKLCYQSIEYADMKSHLVEYHSCEENVNIIKLFEKNAAETNSNSQKFLVPVSDFDNNNKTSTGSQIIIREIQMVEPDTTRERPPPSVKSIEKWLNGLEESANGMGISCLFCDKMYLSSLAIYKHLKSSHGTWLDKIFGDKFKPIAEEVEKLYSVKDSLLICSNMNTLERIEHKSKILLTHFIDSETRAAFEYDSSSIAIFLVRLLHAMNYSYCLFDENAEQNMALDALSRNLRTLLLACVAPQVRDILGFDTENLEIVLEKLFDYIGIA